MSTRPAQSSATVSRDRDLRLQAEVDLVELDPDVSPYPARAAVGADHRAGQDGLAVREHHGDGAPVGDGRAVLLDPRDGDPGAHLGARLLGALDQALRRTRAG